MEKHTQHSFDFKKLPILKYITKISLIVLLKILVMVNLHAQTVSGGWDAASTVGTTGYTNYGSGVIQLLNTTNTGGCDGAAIHETSSTYDPTSGAVFNKCYKVFFGCPGNDNIGSDTKGDGLAFSFWKNSATYNINNGLACGGGLGYMGSASDGKMITIEFDTWSSQCLNNFDCSYGAGNSGDHDEIALQIDGNASDVGKITAIDAGNLEDGLEHSVCISYDPSTKLLSVVLDGTTLFSYTYDLGAYFGSGGLNQTWSSGKAGATNPATISDGAGLVSTIGGPLCPAAVYITSPSNDAILQGCSISPINITAIATPPAGNTVTSIDFLVDGTVIGTDNTSSYEITWNNPTNGSHTLTAVSHYSPSNTTSTSSPVNLTVGASITNTSTAPAIDGTAEALWNSYSTYSLTKGFNNAPNLAGNYKITYDATNLYLLINVTDNVLVNNGGNAWNNDGAEVFIDIGNTKTSTYGSNDFQFDFNYNSSIVTEYKHNATAGVTYAQTVVGGGYILEIKFPWSTLGTTSPATGTTIGFDISLDDNDSGNRDHQVSWNDGTFAEYNNPSLFGSMVFCSPCPTSNAGPNQSVCNVTSATLSGNTPDSGTGTWTLVSGPNTPTITSVNSPNSTVTGMISGTYVFRWTVSNGSCADATSEVTITNNTLPTAPTVGSNSPLCIGGTLNLTSSTVADATSYNWTGPNGFTSTSQNPTLTNVIAAMTGTYSVTVTASNGCTSVAATTSVTVNAKPSSPTAGSNSPLCVTGTINLTASNVTGATSYNWTGPNGFTSTSQNPSIANATAAMSGTYSVTVTTSGSGCTSATAGTTTVTVNTQPTAPTASSNSPLCVTGTINLTASNVTGATSYNWTGPNGFTSTTQNPSIANATAAMSGTYSVTVTTSGSGCTSATAGTTTVTINSQPTAPTASSNSPLCITGTINLTASNVTGATSYNWTGPNGFTSTTQNPSIANATASMSGTYSVTVTTSGSGCTSATAGTTTVTINSQPTAPTASSNSPLCITGTINLTASNVTGATSYNWTGPNGFTSTTQNPSIANATASMNGTYSVTVTTSGSGCTSASAGTTTVTVNTQPAAPTAGSNGPVCNNNAINLSASNVAGASSYNWTGPNGFTSTSQNPTISNATSAMAGTYSVTVTTSGSGCTSAAGTTTVTINPVPSITVTPGDLTICAGNSVVLTASASDGTGNYQYQWSPATNLSSTNTASTTASSTSDITYTVVVSDDNNCSSTPANVTVSVGSNLQPTISGPSELCMGTSNVKYVVNNPSSSSSTFTWTSTGDVTIGTDNGSEVYINIGNSGGSLTVKETTSTCNGQGVSTIVVNPTPTLSVTSASVEMCQGVGATLEASGSGGNGGYVFNWSPTNQVGSNINVNPSSDQTYTVTITDAKGCTDPNGTKQVSVIVNPNPTLSVASSNVEMCQGVPATLTANATGGTGTMTYTWSPVTDVTPSSGIGSTITVNPSSDRTYTVSIKDSKGCEDPTGSKDVNVKINSNPTLSVVSSSVQMCTGGTATLEAAATGGSGAYIFTWTPATDMNPATGIGATISVSPSADQVYTVTLQDSKGCKDIVNPSLDVSVVVNSNPQPLSISGGPNSVCPGTTGIQFTVSPYNNTSSYDWSLPGGFTITGTSGATVTISSGSSPVDGDITVTETTDKNCTSVTPGTKTITINPSTPIAAITGGDRTICSGSINIEGNDPGMSEIVGTWSSSPTVTFGDVNKATTTASDFTSSSVITWTLTGPCGSTSDDITVNLSSASLAVTAHASKDTVCGGVQAEITANVTGSTASPFTFTWTSSDGTVTTTTTNSDISVTPFKNGWTSYLVTVTDATGCSTNVPGMDSIFTTSQDKLLVPSLVTPNGDGKNDCLIIRDENQYDIIPGSQFDLFNRWGEQVYKNTYYKNGDFCGNHLPDGVYYYYIKTSCDNKELKGWLQIISNTENWNQ